MPLYSDTDNDFDVKALGPLAQVQPGIPSATPGVTVPLPLTIAASSTYLSPLMLGDGYTKISIASQFNGTGVVGTLSVIRFLDKAGTLAQTQAAATSLTGGGVTNNTNVVDGLPFYAYQIQIVNSTGSALNLTALGILLQAM